MFSPQPAPVEGTGLGMSAQLKQTLEHSAAKPDLLPMGRGQTKPKRTYSLLSKAVTEGFIGMPKFDIWWIFR